MDQSQQKIINRLHRIEGQVRGVENMVREYKGYTSIIQQLEAVRSATNNLISVLIEEKFCRPDKKINAEDISYLRRFIRRIWLEKIKIIWFFVLLILWGDFWEHPPLPLQPHCFLIFLYSWFFMILKLLFIIYFLKILLIRRLYLVKIFLRLIFLWKDHHLNHQLKFLI